MALYTYKAKVLRCVDGDTVIAQVLLGFHLTAELDFRLLGINTPEMKGESRDAGKAAKAHLVDRIEGREVIIRTEKGDKYGRWLAKIELDGVDINAEMIEKGFAVPFMVD